MHSSVCMHTHIHTIMESELNKENKEQTPLACIEMHACMRSYTHI